MPWRRAALGRPWLVGEIARSLEGMPADAPSAAARAEAALEHLDTLCRSMGEHAGLRHARKHLAAYADHAGGTDPARAKDRLRLVTTEDREEAARILGAFLLNAPQTCEAA